MAACLYTETCAALSTVCTSLILNSLTYHLPAAATQGGPLYHPSHTPALTSRPSLPRCPPAGKPAEWLHQYGWTAYCMPSVPMSQAICGQCVRVTNPRTQATAVLRIVDQCGNGALDLDWGGSFKKIDTNGQGYADGHMNLEVQLVAC